MRELEILVKFSPLSNASASNQNRWCDDIEVFIDYDTIELHD